MFFCGLRGLVIPSDRRLFWNGMVFNSHMGLWSLAVSWSLGFKVFLFRSLAAFSHFKALESEATRSLPV